MIISTIKRFKAKERKVEESKGKGRKAKLW